MEPAVNNCFSGCGRVLPVACHHILALDDDFTFLAIAERLAVPVTDLDFHRLHYTAGRTEDAGVERVCGNDRGSLRKAVALEHRNADGAVVSLELDIQKRTAAHEEHHPAAESLTYILEDDFVEESHKRFFPELEESASIVILLIIGNGQVQCEVVEFLHLRTLGLDSRLNILLEVTCECRNRKHHVRSYLLDGHRDILK